MHRAARKDKMIHERLRPGESTTVPMPVGKDGVITRDAVWEANIHRYQRYAACMAGGDSMLRPPPGSLHPINGGGLPDGSYLRRLPGETSYDRSGNDVWEQRRDMAAHDPISARVIWTYVDTLFRQSMDRASVAAVLGDDILKDVDLQGTDAEDWLSHSYAQGLAQGWMIGLVDMPIDDGDYPSAAHQEAARRRPYVQVILPPRVWGLERDDYGRITWALIHESLHRWREWTSEFTVVYEQLPNKEVEVVQPPEPHGFGRVPMEIFVARDGNDNDPCAPPGESAIQEISLIDIQILQHLSLLDDIQRKTGFPFLWVRKNDIGGVDDEQTLGSDFMFLVDAETKWIAPPKECTDAGRAHIEWLEGLAYKIGGVHRRSMESVEAHSGLALDWENAPIYATVQRWARRLRDWELRLWRLMAEIMGKDGSSIDVVYPDDFSTRPIDQDIGQATAIATMYGGYASAPSWVKTGIDAMIRRALGRTVGHVKEVSAELKSALVKSGPIDTGMSLSEKLSTIEQLVKAGAPQPLLRRLLLGVVGDLGLDVDNELKTAIDEAMLKWYTQVSTEISSGKTREDIEDGTESDDDDTPTGDDDNGLELRDAGDDARGQWPPGNRG